MPSSRFVIRALSLPPVVGETRRANAQRLRDAAHCLAKEMLPPGDWQKGAHGKPYLPDNACFFNLTHCHELVACAVGDMECGLDAEPLSRPVGAALNKVCSPTELAYVEKNGASAFFRLWTLKESFVKCTGDGISYALREAHFLPDGDGLRFCRPDFFFHQWCTDTHVLTLCVKIAGIPAQRIIPASLSLSVQTPHTLEITIGKD